MFIILLNIAPPLTPALFAAFISIDPRLVPVISPTASTTPEAAAIAAPQGPNCPIVDLIPSRTALSPSGKSFPDVEPNIEPKAFNVCWPFELLKNVLTPCIEFSCCFVARSILRCCLCSYLTIGLLSL
jgi:hypothetical protein